MQAGRKEARRRGDGSLLNASAAGELGGAGDARAPEQHGGHQSGHRRRRRRRLTGEIARLR
jgi:hypothetical protein